MNRIVPWSVQMADSIMTQMPLLSEKWDYDWGVTLTGIEAVWEATKHPQYLQFIQSNIDHFVQPDGMILKYNLDENNLDRINTGRLLFTLLDATGEEKYRKALYLLRSQLDTHPRNSDGGFWHKKIYPHQMWLDGIYMASPFYTEFANRYHQSVAYDDVALQILLMEHHARDEKTGLLYHGWDESRRQRWSNPQTGCSPHFWGRAMGWYAMALVDVLEHFPESHPQHGEIVSVFVRLVESISKVQDKVSGLWYQVLDQGERQGNYLEASGSCMFIYAIAKAVRHHWVNHEEMVIARKGYEGVINQLIQVGSSGEINLINTCAVAGLGGNPYRDGSYEYYVGEPRRTNDLKGVGAFLLASTEMEKLSQKAN